MPILFLIWSRFHHPPPGFYVENTDAYHAYILVQPWHMVLQSTQFSAFIQFQATCLWRQTHLPRPCGIPWNRNFQVINLDIMNTLTPQKRCFWGERAPDFFLYPRISRKVASSSPVWQKVEKSPGQRGILSTLAWPWPYGQCHFQREPIRHTFGLILIDVSYIKTSGKRDIWGDRIRISGWQAKNLQESRK